MEEKIKRPHSGRVATLSLLRQGSWKKERATARVLSLGWSARQSGAQRGIHRVGRLPQEGTVERNITRHAWDVVNGSSMALASCKLGGRTNCMHFDDFKNCARPYQKNEFHAMGCLLTSAPESYFRRSVGPRTYRSSSSARRHRRTLWQSTAAPCAGRPSSCPRKSRGTAKTARRLQKRKKSLMYNHGAHYTFH